VQLTSDIESTDPAGLTARVFARLDRRLSRHVSHPLALALSGGGDSIALLRVTAAWARTRGRRVVALTVDHKMQPDSAVWSAFAGQSARALGADWLDLRWDGPKPATGVTAAARAARHRLIAEAARKVGARVVLFAHTADDIAESDWMRARGSTLGRLRDWSPSPAWPEGRGLMLARPLLAERRDELRTWLAGQGAVWIEDPANADLRFGRSQARRALHGTSPDQGAPDPARDGGDRSLRWPHPGVLTASRDVGAATLAAALVCLGGGSTPPRGDRLQALIARLRADEDFVAVLAGARLEARADRVVVMREAGEWLRRPIPPLRLLAGRTVVWDGRCAFAARAPGWSVVPALGRLAALSPSDRAALNRLPAAARGAVPVLLRDGEDAPVLASETVDQHDLTPERLRLALDETTHEDDLKPAADGATPSNALFSPADTPHRRSSPDRRRTEDLNEPA
jgi:tRNA(Ile)-lysidine synthase